MTETFISWGMDPNWAWGVATIAGILLIALPLMLAVAMIIYADRKIWAAIALRCGPNVVGPFGLLQSFADGLKVFLQETIIPSGANRGLFLRSEEHTSELQSLMRTSYAVFCLKKKHNKIKHIHTPTTI